MIGRLVLSDRNIYKLKYDDKYFSARKCYILSESNNDILIKSSKDFNPKDEYVKINPETNIILEGLGKVGDEQSDIDIYYNLYTLDWMSKSKYNKLWEQIDKSFDLAKNRINYNNQVITIDPLDSIDLDDGFSFSFDNKNYFLDIHIADPVSLFDLGNPIWINILKELFTRLQTCYIGTNPTHLLPEKIIQLVSLLGYNSSLGLDASSKLGSRIETNTNNYSHRAISFCFKLQKYKSSIDFNLKFSNLTNIKNYTYENYDLEINTRTNLETKINLVNLTNHLINLMGVNLESISIDSDISHKMIEVFMIFVNWYGGNYLVNNGWKDTIIRTQDSTIFGEEFDITKIPPYAIPILSYGANYIYGLRVENEIEADNKLEVNTDKLSIITPNKTNKHNTLGINNYAHISSPMRRLIDMINHFGFYQVELKKIIPDFNKYFNLEKINIKLKNYKKISNAYDLLKFIKNSSNQEINNNENRFKACLFDWIKHDNSNQIKCILVVYNKQNNFTKVVNVELPQIELTLDLKKYMEFNIEIYYNSIKFKSNKFPFAIKIL